MSSNQPKYMLTDETANTTPANCDPAFTVGHYVVVKAFGVWDTATVTIYLDAPDGTSIALTTFTANGIYLLQVGGLQTVRAGLTSVGGTTSISVTLEN